MLGKSIVNYKLIKNASKWHYNYYFKGLGLPLLSVIYVTSNCNYRCKFCDIWQGEGVWKLKETTLDLGTFKFIIDDLSELGCYYVDITGGEAFLLPDIIERITYAKKRIPYVATVSNGSLITAEVARALEDAKLDFISISVDAMNNGHDKIRGVSGAFENITRAIENLKNFAPSVKVCMNTVITPWNLTDLPLLLQLSSDLNIYHKFQPINLPFSFEHRRKDFFNLNLDDYKLLDDFIQKLIKEKKNNNRILNSHLYLNLISDYFKDMATSNDCKWFDNNCRTPYYHIEIRPDATVHPCNYKKWGDNFKIYGKNSLKNIILSEDYRNLQKNLLKCQNCKKYMFLCYLEPSYVMPMTNFVKSRYQELKL